MRVLVIVIRGLHLGYVGCYGNDWIETPALDRLAAEGVVFDRHYADCPDPSGAGRAWWSGRYGFPLPAGETPVASDGADLVALLQQAGIATTRVGDGGFPEKALEAVRQAVQSLAAAESGLVCIDLALLMPAWKVPEPFLSRYFGEDQEDPEEADEPVEPWTGLLPPALDPGDDTAFLRLQRTYAGAVTYLDSILGQVLDGLRHRGILEGMLLIVTSDHGLPLSEHGIAGGQRLRLHDELIHVPLIVRLPGAAEAGRRIPALTQSVDVMPTLLEVFGLPPAPIHGHSLFPLLRGQAAEVRPYAAAGLQFGEDIEWALHTPDWAFLLPVRAAAGAQPPGPQLYVKPEDRWEVNNVVQHHLELAEHLEQTLRGFVEATRRPGPLQPPPLRAVDVELPAAAPAAEADRPSAKEPEEPG
jgi:arylsulfatase A-like enzyme